MSDAPHPAVSVITTKLDSNAIAYALARNECGAKLPLADVLETIGIPKSTPGLRNMLGSDAFKVRYAAFVRELTESGESFRMKARIQAEELLAVQWDIVQNANTPANVRMDGIKSLVEWADLKPKKAAEGASNAPQISIHIDLGGDKPEAIDITPKFEALEAPQEG